VGSSADRNVNISETIDEATCVFGYAKDALATDDRVNLIADHRQQPRSVLTAGWRIDDGIHQSAAVVAQRGGRQWSRTGMRLRERSIARSEPLLAPVADGLEMKSSHDALDSLVPEVLRGRAMHCRESLAVIHAVGCQHNASRRLEHPTQFPQRCALVGDQE